MHIPLFFFITNSSVFVTAVKLATRLWWTVRYSAASSTTRRRRRSTSGGTIVRCTVSTSSTRRRQNASRRQCSRLSICLTVSGTNHDVLPVINIWTLHNTCEKCRKAWDWLIILIMLTLWLWSFFVTNWHGDNFLHIFTTWHGVYFFIFTVWHGLFSLVLLFPELRISAPPHLQYRVRCIYSNFKAKNQNTRYPLLNLV